MVSMLHTATNTLENSEVFTCRFCRFTDGARAAGTGTGSASATLFHGAAKDAARDGAFMDAIETSRRLIRDATCPRCGKRNGPLAGRQLKYLVVAFVLAVGAAGVPLALSQMLDGARWPVVFAVLPPLLLLISVFGLRGRLMAEDAAVSFTSRGGPVEGPLPPLGTWLGVGAAPFLGLSFVAVSAVLWAPAPEPAPRPAVAPPPPVETAAPPPAIDPHRDEAMRAGVVSTCLDGKDSDARKQQCACAADAFLKDASDDALKELRSAGWSRDTLAALEVARRACSAR
jgi:hypothetical protein